MKIRRYGLLAAAVALSVGAGYGARVQGVVTWEAGKPAVGLSVVALAAEGQNVAAAGTSAQGGFTLELPPGEYRLVAVKGGEARLLAELAVGGEDVVGLDLQVPTAPPAESAERERTSPDPRQSLAAIRDLDKTWNRNLSDELLEAVNPFSFRRQGRLFGSLYEFHRNDNFDARNFFDPVGEPLPEYKRNQFGGTLGWRLGQRTTFQGAYDGLRIVQGSTLLAHVPTPEMKRGDFSALETPLRDPVSGDPFPGNQIPLERIHPVTRRLLDVIPDPNRSDPDRNFVNNDPVVYNQDHFNVRLDRQTESRASLTVEYYYTGAEGRRVRPFPRFNSTSTERHQESSIAYSRPISERLSFYTRAEVGRNRTLQLSVNSGSTGLLHSLGIAGLQLLDPLEEGFPVFYLTGYTGFGDSDSPDVGIRNRFSWDSSVNYVRGDHTLRGGFELDYVQLNNQQDDALHRGSFWFSGDYTGDAFADFLLGHPETASRGVGSNRADLRRFRWEFFFRDRWRISPKFELSVGISYRYAPPYRSVADNVSTLYPLCLELPADARIVVIGSPEAAALGFSDAVPGTLIFPDRNDWSPSIALAYAPFASNRLMLRASGSIWYDTPDTWLFLQSLTRNYPFYYVESVSGGEDFLIDLAKPFASAAPPETTFRGLDPWLRNPRIYNWRLAVESELTRNWNIEIAYEGRRGVQMIRQFPGNVPVPGPGPIQERRPNPAFGRISIASSGGSFWGHELNLSAERRLADGFSLRSGFEWNRFLDDGAWGDPQNPRDLRAEKATVVWIPRRRLYVNYILDLPLQELARFVRGASWFSSFLEGWRLSGITELRDGQPFTVSLPGDPNNDGVYGDRPNRIASGTLPAGERSIDRWFDTSAFATPPPYGFGDAGRNILWAPGYKNWDISVIKQHEIGDGDRLELRVELFNAFNNVNFERPNAEFGSDLFGKIFGADRAREIEVAVKYTF
ncbi:MAG: hypothetical protein Kow00109_13320 [Acidobacteriota bacterium]